MSTRLEADAADLSHEHLPADRGFDDRFPDTQPQTYEPEALPEVPTLLVMGTGHRQFREYVMVAMAEQALLVAVDTQMPSWQSHYMEDFATCAADLGSQLVAARDLARRYRVAGVVCLDERFALAAALLAEELALPSPGSSVVRTCLDRWQTRTLLNSAGVGTVRARLAASVREAEQAAAELGLPVILRARHHLAGGAAQRVDRLDEIEQAFLVAGSGAAPGAPKGRPGGVVLEELLEGPQVTLCCTVENGRARTWFSVHRETMLTYSHESRQYLVDAHGNEPSRELEEFARRAHAALGVRHGVTHLNVALTSKGPRVTRAGVWLAGDLMPLIGCMATGVDLPTDAARLALGLPGRERVEFRRAAGVRLVYPAAALGMPAPGVNRVVSDHAGTVLVRSIQEREVELIAPAGDLSAVALLAAEAADGPSCRAALEAAAQGRTSTELRVAAG